jgi:hypothetical protein
MLYENRCYSGSGLPSVSHADPRLPPIIGPVQLFTSAQNRQEIDFCPFCEFIVVFLCRRAGYPAFFDNQF